MFEDDIIDCPICGHESKILNECNCPPFLVAIERLNWLARSLGKSDREDDHNNISDALLLLEQFIKSQKSPQEILDFATDELMSVQLIQNTWQDAKISSKEIEDIFKTVIKMAQDQASK